MSVEQNMCRSCEQETDVLAHTLVLPNHITIPLFGLCVQCASKVREALIRRAFEAEAARFN